jgi:hypothetical protein
MYSQLTQSVSTLDRLQSQTETYVNGSLTTMDNMSGKVGQLSGSMAEVDGNLNYLLGRIALVTREFNMIKVSALNLKNVTFNIYFQSYVRDRKKRFLTYGYAACFTVVLGGTV